MSICDWQEETPGATFRLYVFAFRMHGGQLFLSAQDVT